MMSSMVDYRLMNQKEETIDRLEMWHQTDRIRIMTAIPIEIKLQGELTQNKMCEEVFSPTLLMNIPSIMNRQNTANGVVKIKTTV